MVPTSIAVAWSLVDSAVKKYFVAYHSFALFLFLLEIASILHLNY